MGESTVEYTVHFLQSLGLGPELIEKHYPKYCLTYYYKTERERPDDPTYVVHDVVHYAVGNIPGAVPRTSTYALANATLPYLRDLAGLGIDDAIARRPELAPGVNTPGQWMHPGTRIPPS